MLNLQLSLFILLMVNYEYYLQGIQMYNRVCHQKDRERTNTQQSLGCGPLQPSPILPEETPSANISTFVPRLHTDGRVRVAAAQSRVPDTLLVMPEPRATTSTSIEQWEAIKLPAFSSRTFSGPFGRSEQEVLARLSKLEETCRLSIGASTIGRSVYRNAVQDDSPVYAVAKKIEIVRPLTSPSGLAIYNRYNTDVYAVSGRKTDNALVSHRLFPTTPRSVNLLVETQGP